MGRAFKEALFVRTKTGNNPNTHQHWIEGIHFAILMHWNTIYSEQ